MNIFKQYILVLLLGMACSFTAQNKRENSDKIKALKATFITNELNLTAKEAQKFWPVYNTHNDKLHKLREELRKTMGKQIRAVNGIENMSEATAKKLINFKMATDKKIYEEEKQMTKALSEVISHKKIIKLQMAELDFRRKLISKLRGRPRNRE